MSEAIQHPPKRQERVHINYQQRTAHSYWTKGRERKNINERDLVREDGDIIRGKIQEDPGLTTGPAAATAEAPSWWNWGPLMVGLREIDASISHYLHHKRDAARGRGVKDTRDGDWSREDGAPSRSETPRSQPTELATPRRTYQAWLQAWIHPTVITKAPTPRGVL